jgi:hypothetical protein
MNLILKKEARSVVMEGLGKLMQRTLRLANTGGAGMRTAGAYNMQLFASRAFSATATKKGASNQKVRWL